MKRHRCNVFVKHEKEEGIRNLYEIDKANSARGRLLYARRV